MSRRTAYEKAKAIASRGSLRARRRLAARRDAPPEILYYLAGDPEPDIRRAIAGNTGTPVQADLILARDADARVREHLASKIARLVPGLTAEVQDRLAEHTLELLEILARDELPRIRAILADALAEVTGAPPPKVVHIVKRLARDEVIEVARPVLEHSVLLTDEDLLEIIRADPVAGALSAIANRATVGADVADAIAAGDDTQAITVLLANPSAQIREETLDRIIDRAPEIEPWHAPLVRRPRLSSSAARRIAGFVAESLLKVLRQREDLDPETAGAVAEAVSRRLDGDGAPAKNGESGEKGKERPLDRARRLAAAGRLNEQSVAKAVASGDRGFVVAALAVLAELPLDVVRDMVASKSGKAVTALAWKAGLTMRFAVDLQMRYAGILPRSVLYARNGFEYPLSEEDMRWQIEFFGG